MAPLHASPTQPTNHTPLPSCDAPVHAVGQLGVLQIKDLNAGKSASQRTYAGQVGTQGAPAA